MEREIKDITNHPLFNDVTRKAQVSKSYKEYDNNKVILVLNIFHYKDNQELKYFPKQISLIADNETKVDPNTGSIVLPNTNGEYPTTVIGEYDYLWSIVNVVKTYTEVELEELYINLRIDKINSKLYG